MVEDNLAYILEDKIYINLTNLCTNACVFCIKNLKDDVVGKDLFLKLYPVVVSATFLFVFGSTLFLEPTMIFRFATLADKSIIGAPYENQVKRYCKRVKIAKITFSYTPR